MDRKGQMTTFMIIGVVIILFSSLGFYLYRESTMSSFKNKVDTIAQQMKITALDNYVEACLRSALMEKLDSVALRGGFLDDGEMIPFTSRGIVSVAIPEFADYGDPEYPATPDYPNTPEQEFHIEPLTPYPFGGRSLRKLCQLGGPNDAPLHIFARPCPRGSYGTESIQQDLNVHVKTALENCVDPEYMNEVTGYEIEVGTPIVSIVFGEEDVRAEAEYPITINIDGDQAVRTIDFASEVPVRIKKVYGLAQHIINNDRTYISYNKHDRESTEWQSEYYDRRMQVSIECPKCLGGTGDDRYTDVVTITDTKSNMDGKYLLFKFAITNRIPVLEPMRGPSAGEHGGEFYDFIMLEATSLTISPVAMDPDEDEITFTYVPDGSLLPAFSERGGVATIRDPPPGPHTLTIIACDEAGDHIALDNEDNSCDYQDVKIYVTTSVTLETGVGCYYEDVTNCVSLEDPFILTTSGTIGTFTWISPITRFTDIPSRTTFPDDVFEYYLSFITGGFPELCLPRDAPDCTSALTLENVRRNKILWIKDFLERYLFTGAGRNMFTLEAGDETDTVPVIVSECISYGDPDINPPYPYNLPGDAFTAAHTCCDRGNIKGTSAICYRGTTYGPDLSRGAYDDRANDVYEKIVTHKCDGVRGNMCTDFGEKTEEISAAPLRGCADFEIPNQVERCEGPSVTTRPGTDILTYECKQYDPSESFEFEFGLDKKSPGSGNANGICSDTTDFADFGGDGMFDTTRTGPFRCQAQCKSGTCSFAADCVCAVEGQPGAGDIECIGVTYSALQASGGRGVATSSGKLCDITCQVVGPEITAAACRAAIESIGGTWEPPRSYSSGRPGSERCCGNSAGEFLPASSGERCCSVPDSCIIGRECVAPGETDTTGRRFCDAGTSRSMICLPTNECDVVGTKYCAGDRWIDLVGDVIGKTCGGTTAQCGTCREHPRLFEIRCLADSGRCSGGTTCNADLQCV